jgi:hypothetical protein
MNIFSCGVCEQTVFFESVMCTRCQATLAFLPERWAMMAAKPGAATGYRLCRNYTEHAVCNWAIPTGDGDPYCRACRLNHMIPNLADAHAKEAWHRVEMAKRRLLYALLALGLPVETKAENPSGGLAFDFLQDSGPEKVFTGHSEGLITINIAEADDPFREKMREQMGETYRTVLGHFRHESGHYYWERLIDGGPLQDQFRRLFGDERASYDAARDRHYRQGPPPSWWDRFVSSYASMHPWEDWAETWAHYLHMVDGLETARAHGLSLRPAPTGAAPERAVNIRRIDIHSFDDLLAGWLPLTVALNNMNRSFGTNDCYPFVLTEPAINKLRFVHDVVERASG